MISTPLWVPLVVAALGLVGTIVGTVTGVLITQRRSDRRDDQAWERQRQRERDQWAREDQLRTFDQRREAYVEFYESLQAMAEAARDHGMGLGTTDELDPGWHRPTLHRLQQLRVYASSEVRTAADRAYYAVWSWGQPDGHDGVTDESFRDRRDVYTRSESELFEAIRRDLGVPTAEAARPGPSDPASTA